MEIKELIELILGVLVVVAIVVGVSIFFKDQVISFFKGLTTGKQAGVFIFLIK